MTRQTVAALRVWLADHNGGPDDALFATSRGQPLSRDAAAKMITKHAARAAVDCPSIATKHVTPHTLRHSAVALLHAGVGTSVIALWLAATRTPAPRRPTCTPTWPSKSKPSPASLPRTPAPAAPDAFLAFLDNI